MAVFETWLKCDLQQMVQVEKLTGNVFTADNQANRIGVIVTDGGESVTLTEGVTGYVIRQDDATVVVIGSTSGNRAWIDLPASAYTVPGLISIVIKLGTTTVGACCGQVSRTTTDTIVDPGHVIPSIEELLAKIADCEAATAAAIAATTAANTATTAANSAASSANSAASNANTKAALADEKATAANTAAGAANTAAGSANTAATNANTKAALADEKASLADQKATLANTAAANADDKASAANTAAGSANTAAAAANAATATVNTATAKINNMTVDSESLASSASASATISEVSGHKHIHFGIPRGADGKDGIIAKVDLGLFSMAIDNNGDLICTYSTEAPALEIDENGDLIFTI